ncbi:MAG: hypothetical protein COW26_05405 [Nitrosopumilales archaeon CG15_BIG_FIL_POST_REV_8_21_14_020_33_23]|nr:MAG: hypothetical protein COV65_03785 [Nitrosopumilales archaeon CG11_big_fil_rev_8_21_14_0_20_33_24]PIW35050.1 MAG: hypothetical protein COW26_05405 [Nitrosopumilales archaeon CG15_BIG_FIL_POST_REV_8_21_14_020_33_23]PIY89433.1 MAG: hypothetical protein COY74_05885 [Nitrosopumilales archaeon CG_4_10_14_0_8_um_filter_34_8]PJB98527.1 MAG: hypothetical protein CO079_01985 [Nitrosopumilales archaeon CG_4_9_14_0_8_um_filter_34_10]
MKKFSEIKVGDEFFSTCSISEKELTEYFKFSRVKNAFLEDMQNAKQKIISGRAILSRMEGEFTRLSQIYGNHIVFVGTDGDAEWENRSSRFLKPLYTDDILKIKFTVSAKEDIDEEFGKIAINYEGTKQNGEIVVLSKKNWYRIKKSIT